MKLRMDVMTPAQRRKAMAHNRGRTRPERALASGLWRKGVRYFTYEGYRAVSGRRLQGRPDVVLPRKRFVVFVDGCFWHGCPECDKRPEQSGKSWADKIQATKERDRQVTADLETQGWRVLRVPEHSIRTKKSLAQTVDSVAQLILASSPESQAVQTVKRFVTRETKPPAPTELTAVSLFSGGGLSDLGYELAGFRFVVHVEADERRAEIGADNFPDSKWITANVQDSTDAIVQAYRKGSARRLDLLTATPPCQGMSSSNPSRGKRQTPQAQALEAKNRLMLELIPIAEALKPRVVVAENVRQILTLDVEHEGGRKKVVDLLREGLPQYQVFSGVVNVADYGIPQVRKRALVVAIHEDEPGLKYLADDQPWPRPGHAEQPLNGAQPWVSVRQWLNVMQYEPLDASCEERAHGKHPLHYVPAYGGDRYQQVSGILPYSGRSAYENDTCPSCGQSPVETGLIRCPHCDGVMRNRPYAEKDGQPYLIKGFHSSYRRMNPDRPAYTITTNSSHVGSDFKIHPWENRVLSILECADLQTVPRFYDWKRAEDNRTRYLVRNLVGEALPPYFTYLHGQYFAALLGNKGTPE